MDQNSSTKLWTAHCIESKLIRHKILKTQTAYYLLKFFLMHSLNYLLAIKDGFELEMASKIGVALRV